MGMDVTVCYLFAMNEYDISIQGHAIPALDRKCLPFPTILFLTSVVQSCRTRQLPFEKD